MSFFKFTGYLLVIHLVVMPEWSWSQPPDQKEKAPAPSGRKRVDHSFNPDPGGVSDLDLTPRGAPTVEPLETRGGSPPEPPLPRPPGASVEESLPDVEVAPEVDELGLFGETTLTDMPPHYTPPDDLAEIPADYEMLDFPPLPSRRSVVELPDLTLHNPGYYDGQEGAFPGAPGALQKLYRQKLKLKNPGYPMGRGPQGLPPYTEAKPDRWRLGFEPWRRFDDTRIESTYQSPEAKLWHPYRQSLLKGDLPLIGQDIFLALFATNQTVVESRNLPTPSGVSGARADNAEFYGRGNQFFIRNDTSLIAELFKGETAFKPVTWLVRVQGIYNFNYLNAEETGVVSPDPRGPIRSVASTNLNRNRRIGDVSGMPNNRSVRHPGDVLKLLEGRINPPPGSGQVARRDLGRRSSNTRRFDDHFALQQAFLEIHLADFTSNYDFLTSRLGLQPFVSDFRGFLFNETNLGLRFFGNLDNNRWQTNLAYFDMREKDSNSELNTFDSRHQKIFVFNIFRQDTFVPGYTTLLSFHANLDDSSTYFNTNGFINRPAPIGLVAPHDVKSFYIGLAGEGHIGWLNVSHTFYQALGRDDLNGIAGQAVDINAQMAAVELSVDKDWVRYKASVFYASGDRDAGDSKAQGFDAIVDNPFFLGSPFSYYVRQGFNLGGTAVNLKQRESLLPNLRTSKFEGQSNFVNPGLFALGFGVDLEITPKLRCMLQANYLRFMHTDSLQRVLVTDKVDPEIGYDLSIGFIYRPLLTDNVVITGGIGALIPGQGMKDIYRTSTRPVQGYEFDSARSGDMESSFLYSGILAVTLTF